MKVETVTNGLRQWLIGLFATAIKRTSRPEDRHAAIEWLIKSRDILASDLGMGTKLKDLNAQINSRATVSALAVSVADAVKQYRSSSLPWPMKIAVPATLLAVPVVGGHGAGIVAFGGGIGLPVLLLVFLGTAGVTSIIETVARNPNSSAGVAAIVDRILRDEALRRASADFKAAMRDEAASPRAADMPEEKADLVDRLITMDPYDFESHVMSFFEKAGFYAVVTPRSNDFGMDGYASHPSGLIVTQCKRNAANNKVGRPELMQFDSVIRHQGAWRGYFVTTSTFSRDAKQFSVFSPSMVLVDIEDLVHWHATPPTFK